MVRITAVVLVGCLGCGRSNFDFDAAPDSMIDARVTIANIVFVTSTSQLPTTFGADLAGADAVCAARAAAGGLPGRYVAYLSSSAVAARDRLAGSRGWVRTDGRPFIDRIEDLTSGKLYHPLSIDELGDDVGGAVAIATGTDEEGINAGNTCLDFTDSGGSIQFGTPVATAGQWVNAGVTNCRAPMRLYCFGLGLTEPLRIQPAAGRRAFVTAQPLTPNGGLAGADALCTSEASLAGLTGRFRALLPTSTASAASRFSLTGSPWVRLDGIVIADSPLALVSIMLRTTLNVSSIGQYSNSYVFTGGSFLVPVDAGDTCGDWTDPNGNTALGFAHFLDDNMINTTGGAMCSSPRPIYCLED